MKIKIVLISIVNSKINSLINIKLHLQNGNSDFSACSIIKTPEDAFNPMVRSHWFSLACDTQLLGKARD